MPLHFIFGASGAGKSHYIYQKIIQESMEHPWKQYLVLVPEQFTMQTQKELVMMHPRKGILNIDVLSFERLAYRVLEETGESCAQVLEETGASEGIPGKEKGIEDPGGENEKAGLYFPDEVHGVRAETV